MSNGVVRQRLDDFARYREQLRCWDTDVIQLSSGPPSIEFDRVDAEDVILVHLRFDRGVAERSVGRPGWHALVVDLSPKQWCGIDIPSGTLRLVPPGRETRTLTREPWESISVFIRSETLVAWGLPFAQLAGWNPDPAHCVLASDPDAVDRYRARVQMLLRDGLPPESSGPGWVLQQLKAHLTDLIARQGGLRAASSIRRVSRYGLVLAAQRMIQQQAGRRVTVKDLSRRLGVLERTLQYAFTDVVGMSPAQYILTDRLNRARRDLVLEARSGTTVTTTAYDHLFENLSRFALHYTRLFGERPSETLRAARAATGDGTTHRNMPVRLSDSRDSRFRAHPIPANRFAPWAAET